MNTNIGHNGRVMRIPINDVDATGETPVNYGRFQKKFQKISVDYCNEIHYPHVQFLHKNKEEELKTTTLTEAIKKTGNEKRGRSKWKVWRSRVATAIVGVVVICAVALVGMRLAGFRTFTVMSGSMEPEFPVGAMIYVQPVNYSDLKEGDVISFVANDDKTVVTHRIDEIVVDEQDTSVWRFRTKGDANTAADTKLVHYKNVLGTPVVVIPFIGYLAHNIQQPPGIYITIAVGTLLLAWMFLPDTLEGRRKTARKSVA